MKTNKRLLFAFITPLLLTGCSGLSEPTEPVEPNPPVHEHTFSEEWSYNDTMHWHQASCEHTDLTSDLGQHSFTDEGECSVCHMPIPSSFKKVTFNGVNLKLNAERYYKLFMQVTMSITPSEGYKLPKGVVVSGMNNVIYDRLTGTITGVVVDNIVVTAEAIEIGASYYISKEVSNYSRNDTNFTDTVTYDFDLEEKTLVIEKINVQSNKYYTATTKQKTEIEYNDNYQKTSEVTYNDFLGEGYELYERITYEYNDKGLLTRVLTNFGGEASLLYVYTYDEFNRLLTDWRYSNDKDELPSYRQEYVYHADHYEYMYYYNYDVLANHLIYREEIDAEKGLRYLREYTYGEEELQSISTYDIKSDILLSIDHIFQYHGMTINENNDQINAEYYIREDETIIKQEEQTNTYDENGFLQYVEITTYDYNGENPKAKKAVYEHDEDMYVEKITAYSVEEPTQVLESYEYEVTLLNKKNVFPSDLSQAMTKGSYPRFMSRFNF